MRHRCSPGRNLLAIYRICAVLSLPYYICLSHLFYGKRSTKLSTSPPFIPAEGLVIKLDLVSESILLAGIMANVSPVELLLFVLRSTDLLPARHNSTSYTHPELICCYGQVRGKSDLHKVNIAMPGLSQSPANPTSLLLCGKSDTLMKKGAFLKLVWSLVLGWADPCHFPQSKKCSVPLQGGGGCCVCALSWWK